MSMDIKEAYKILQAASGIEVGDTVKVVRKFVINESGSSCTGWETCFSKKKMQGSEYKVHGIESRQIELESDKGVICTFPFSALELIKKAGKSKMHTINGKDVSEETIANALRRYAK